MKSKTSLLTRTALPGLFLMSSLLLGFSVSSLKAAEITYQTGAKITMQSIYEDNRDLGTRQTKSGKTLTFSAQPDLEIDIGNFLTVYGEGRFLKTYGDGGAEDDNGQISTSDRFLELREAWISYHHLLNIRPLSLKIGHQRIRDDRNLWWNDDLDAIRISYDSTLFKGFAGIVYNMASYRTSHDDFLEDDQDRLRLLAEGSWLYHPHHQFEWRSLYEHDRSGTENTGELVITDNRDDQDYDLIWLGGRMTGTFQPQAETINAIKYRADLITVLGEETLIASTSTADPFYRMVTGQQQRDVQGWALDAGLDIDLDIPFDPVITLNYAFGSGDDDPASNTNNAYRDTDMNGNTSRYGILSQNLHNYGDALRPDLENLHIFSFGTGFPIFKNSDAHIFYHHYRRDEKNTAIGSSRSQASLNNTSHDIGNEIDLAMNIDLETEMANIAALPRDTAFRFSAGAFLPGDAYETPGANDDPLWRVIAELKFKF